MAHSNNSSDEPISEINIVPFVDIVLVLLIIFMVTTPLIMNPSLQIELPKGASGEKTKPSLFQVSITADKKIFFKNKSINLDNLKSLADQYLKDHPTGQAVISADQSVPHGFVVEILDNLKSVGLKKLALSMDRAG